MKLPSDADYRDLYHILETNAMKQTLTQNNHNHNDDNISEFTIITTEQILLYESFVIRVHYNVVHGRPLLLFIYVAMIQMICLRRMMIRSSTRSSCSNSSSRSFIDCCY